jgi:hypothetical protein
LIYWFAADPARPEVFEYSAALHEENRDYLTRLIAEVLDREDEVWPLTENLKHCEYCVYRSLCDRGVRAGMLEDASSEAMTSEADFDFPLDEVEEIIF